MIGKRKPCGRAAAVLAAFVFVFGAAPVMAQQARNPVTVLNYDGMDHAYRAAPIRLEVNGATLLDLPMPPVLFNDYTLAPAREIFEFLGAVVDWKEDTKEVYIGYKDSLVVLQIDNPFANVNGNMMHMQIPPKIINGKTMIPLRFPSEAFGFTVEWDGDTRTVNVSTPEYMSSQLIYHTDPTTDGLSQIYQQLSQDASGNIDDLGSSLSPDRITGKDAELSNDISAHALTRENHPLVKIESIEAPREGSPNRFVIYADGPVSRVDKMLLPDNRLVVDFYNAEWALESQYELVNAVVSNVRSAQNQTAPEMITRVVFDLKIGVNYEITLSADRRSLTVSFERNHVTEVRFAAEGDIDRVYITGTLRPGLDIFPLTEPDRLVVDIPLATMESFVDQAVQGRYVTAVRAGQFDENTARVTIQLKGVVKYDVSYTGDTAVVAVSDVTFRNIEYERNERAIYIRKDPMLRLPIESITQTDHYNNYTYVFGLPGDYSGLLGFGDYIIRDQYIDGIKVANNEGRTELVIYENQVMAFNISETQDHIIIKAVRPREKYPRIVVIDPGHGGGAPGAAHNGLVEKDLTLDIGLRLLRLIESDGHVKAYSTRVSDVNPDLYVRPVWASQIGDMFLSIHFNATDWNSTASGTETYYSELNNAMINGFNSERLAEIILRNTVAGLGTVERKVLAGNFIVLQHSTIPAVLCEIEFLSTPHEAEKIADAEYRQKAAESLYAGILEAFGAYSPPR